MKSEFLTPLKIEEGDKEGTWVLSEPLIYRSEILKDDISIPKGFVTDLASVPRVPIFYMLFGDRAHHEAVVHDWLFYSNIVWWRKANRIFLEAMKARKKPFHIRWPMYLGVEVGAYSAWASHRKKGHPKSS